jgi:hypothetical protein
LCLGSTMSGVTKRTVESCLLRVESSEGFRHLTLAPAFESVRRTSSGLWPPSPQSGKESPRSMWRGRNERPACP